MLIWKKFKFGIIDVDGTIFDNMEICADAFIEIIKEFSLPKKEVRKIYLETNGMNLNDQLRLIFDKYGVQYNNALINKFNKEFFDLRDSWEKWLNAPLFPDIELFLKNLRENGVKIFVSSGSNTDEVIFRLKKVEIFEYFELVLGAEKTPKGLKHYAEFAQYCHENIKDFAAKAFLVSDGPNDMALAQKTGIFAIGITNTVSADKLKSASADLVIKGFNELKKLKF